MREILSRETCDICSRPIDEQVNGRRGGCIDHDHVTGKVRGLLDGRCNTMLGLADESSERLFEAQVYLARAELDLRDLCQSA